LDIVAADRPELAPQCEALAGELHQLLDPPAAEPEWDDDDGELPF
jgi:hypothetical protein